ncbi:MULTISPECIES: Pls/PosA family non-ribosomal peptide synthetase [Streptomyces]|uniref:Non-ribosomal peptide synthetase n=1 Tax=Streptomyces sviceus (strain ATCC 29083 / DSM 924 / JCM 4929 / NBRC 13980 / NCIMB 11184 / NRRL 5439 / UC 5370) TaxID=463191 RepID=B5HR94_STRX2|nr:MULTISPECIES: Pls/PosA family non-ribosomal peptide synthetase [Streptomyces]EDY55349.1 non-ribosomal peptide synthetase [Streptomyces sviceus ATCC 29083]
MVVNPGEITTVAPVDGTAQVLAEVLAGVVKTDQVPLDSHFFDDLGANSLVMAQFCARVRKRDDLPQVSMRDVYGHPTIRGLATALAEVPAIAPAPARPAEPPPPPGSTARHALCGVLQFLVFAVYCFAAGVATAEGYTWISDADGLLMVYLRSLVLGGALFLALCTLPVVAKWVLVGRWQETEFPVWSLAYVRFWLVKALLHASPMVLFTGNPLYVLYLRALGARIGPGVTVLSHSMPVCTDLLTVGAGTVIRKDALLLGYRAHAGRIRTGPVTLGRDVFVGEKTVLDIGTSIGDGGQLGHSSALYDGAAIPAGERWHGSPARPTDVDHIRVPAARCTPTRRAGYALVALLQTLLVYVPLGIGGVFLVMDLVPALDPLLDPNAKELASAAFYAEALVLSVALFVGFVVLGLVTVTVLPRLLNLTLKADRVYPLYGFHYSVQRAIARMTNIKFFKWLCGDSSYIVPYLRSLGYDLSHVEQTGSNFGTEVAHETPYLATVGSGTMVADGLSILNAEYSSTSFRLSRVTIGGQNFLGNHIAYPVGGRTGDNCLLATKVLVPLDGELREGVGLLGSPPFEIPRTVERDTRFDHFREGDELRRRLSAKNRSNARTMALFLFLRWLHWFLLTLLGFAAVDLYGGRGALGGLLIGAYLMTGLAVTVGYWALVERVITRFRPLQPRLCSIYDPYFWWHERLWKVPDQHLVVFNGTPFKSLVWRLLGVRIGRRVFDDGCYLTERTLVAIGSDTTLGHHSKVQAHSQEDGTFKSDHIVIGDGCTLGTGALVHYGVAMGDGSVLGADAFLMKGEEMPAGAHWGGNPAVALRRA